MPVRRLQLIVGAALLSAATATSCDAAGTAPSDPPIVTSYARFMVGSPPAKLSLDPFYQKYVDADGIPITTSDRVPDLALLVARDIVLAMLSERPDLRDELIAMGARVGVMAVDETTTDLPEQSDWTKPAIDDPRLSRCDRENYHSIAAMTDREYWAARARGMGGLYTTGAAENILGVPGTRYFGENILVHEFAHNILEAIRRADPLLYAQIERAFTNARLQTLWKSSYASINVNEYWAEGVQFWFNSNMAYKAGGLEITSADDMRRHDPALHNVLDQVFRADHRIGADVFHLHPARLASKPVDLENDCYS